MNYLINFAFIYFIVAHKNQTADPILTHFRQGSPWKNVPNTLLRHEEENKMAHVSKIVCFFSVVVPNTESKMSKKLLRRLLTK